MALLSIKVPEEVSRVLTEIQVPGEATSADSKHITLVYLGKDAPMSVVLGAIQAVYDVAQETKPIALSTEEVTTFPKGDDGVPVIAKVLGDDLHKLQKKLCEALDKNKVPFPKTYPTYKPHITLSYSPKETESFSIEPLEWTAYEMLLSGGSDLSDRISVKIPFQVVGKTALHRMLVRAATLSLG